MLYDARWDLVATQPPGEEARDNDERHRLALDAIEDGAARAALLRHLRWSTDVVERHSFCPYARTARRTGDGWTGCWVGATPLDPQDELPPALAEALDRVLSHPTHEVAQVVFPGVDCAPRVWDKLARAWTDRWHAGRPGPSVWAMAAFHPNLEWDADTEFGRVQLLRRTPDPTIQWLRLSVLERLRDGRDERDRYVPPDPVLWQKLLREPPRPSLTRTIAEANRETIARLGGDAIVQQIQACAHATPPASQRVGVQERPKHETPTAERLVQPVAANPTFGYLHRPTGSPPDARDAAQERE